MFAVNRIATTYAESASVWAIRFALILMVGVLILEAFGKSKIDRSLATSWFIGAVLSLCHSAGALATFHQGSQSLAFQATEEQTKELLGIQIGAGLFVNYAFVLVWIADACIRLFIPARYCQFPAAYALSVQSFLVFIAINGAIVFQQGWTRWIGILCVVSWLIVIAYQRSRRGPRPRGGRLLD